uniref:Reverse transcriptase Ty1/copia-type domain-containing protein n=1 Tax=Fagus sylvatica TaxID=28930 RepID=A0A2N9H263_FAGSY
MLLICLPSSTCPTCKPCSTPFVSLSRIRKDDGIPLPDPTPFRSMVGGLQYLTFTRPDLSYVVNHICQFMHQPTDHHLVVAKRILRYVQGTLHHGLTFRPGPLSLTAFTDSDWAGDPMDRRSTTGLIVFLGHNPITWQSKKQPTVARSSTEAEYRALANCAADLAWPPPPPPPQPPPPPPPPPPQPPPPPPSTSASTTPTSNTAYTRSTMIWTDVNGSAALGVTPLASPCPDQSILFVGFVMK